MGYPPGHAGRGPRRDRGRGLRFRPVVPRPGQHRPRAVRTAGGSPVSNRRRREVAPGQLGAITPGLAAPFGVERLADKLELPRGPLHPLPAAPGSPSAAATTAACASANPASIEVSCHNSAERSAISRWRCAFSRSPTCTHAIDAGTDIVIEQNGQASSSTESRLGTVDDWARASMGGSDAARIIVPKTRYRRCLAITELRASGKASWRSSFAAALSPWAMRTSASRCKQCASPAVGAES